MNSFVNAIANQEARTENGMKALASTTSKNVDLFFKIGASRGKDITADFTSAYVEDRDTALRIAQWARDIRGGAGERKLFHDIINNLINSDEAAAIALLRKAPDLGRWDDVLVAIGAQGAVGDAAVSMIKSSLDKGDGLCAKWMPRKGALAATLREKLGWTPKYYRKRLVELTKVVETQMCANDWDNINFNHVPSVASARYKKAFKRHTAKYAEWTTKLVSTDPSVRAEVKVNAGAVYPYDVIKGLSAYGINYDKSNLDHIVAQWEALPNFVGDASILPIVDVSGSMACKAGGYQSKSMTTCLDVSVSLGLYLADKNKGVFKDTFLTFSTKPQLVTLKGNIVQKIEQMIRVDWEMDTNLHAAIKKILDVAIKGKVPQSDMPKMLLILSDMQFNGCVEYDDSAIEMIRRKYTDAGYEMPKVVFWNLNAHENVPVKENENGVALVSGFSPSIVKSVLAADLSGFTPEAIMRKTIMVERYDY
jgi:hypothetical protein